MDILELSQTFFFFSASAVLILFFIFLAVSIYLKIKFYKKTVLAIKSIRRFAAETFSFFLFLKRFLRRE